MKDRIVSFALGVAITIIAFYAGKADNLNANNHTLTCEQLIVEDKIVVGEDKTQSH